VQLVALLEDQEKVVDCPTVMEVGLTETLRVGAGAGAETTLI